MYIRTIKKGIKSEVSEGLKSRDHKLNKISGTVSKSCLYRNDRIAKIIQNLMQALHCLFSVLFLDVVSTFHLCVLELILRVWTEEYFLFDHIHEELWNDA